MLTVLRHGLSEWNIAPLRCQGQLDISLSNKGRDQAKKAARYLSPPDVVYSSHLSRARETAEIICKKLFPSGPKPEILVDPRLAEAHCGVWQGVEYSEIEKRWPEEWLALRQNDPDFAFPKGGEKLSEVLERFSNALGEIQDKHKGQDVLVITHGGPIEVYLASRSILFSKDSGSAPKNLEGFVFSRGEIRLFSDVHQEKGISRSTG